MKNLLGIGVLLRTSGGTFLLQERDHNTVNSPGRVALFGGGIEDGETALDCAVREMREELMLEIAEGEIRFFGDFPSLKDAHGYFQIFLIDGVDPADLILQEGKAIVELTRDKALGDYRVTDFTKSVLEKA